MITTKTGSNYMLFVLFLTLSEGILASTCKKKDKWKNTIDTYIDKEKALFFQID